MAESLRIIHSVPEGFLEVQPEKITQIIDHPTLIHLKGEKEPPLFISVLLHGNEYSGLVIIQKILKKYVNLTLPHSLILFIANPKASAKGLRHLKHQPDFNRIWKGHSLYKETLVKPLLQYLEVHKIQTAVDIHNNTGRNPVYSCINKKTKEFIKLAQAFSKNIVYFTKPDSVLSLALSRLCPSVVIECGLPGEVLGIDSGFKFIETLLDKEEKWKQARVKENFIYNTYGTLYIASDSHISFNTKPFVKNNTVCFREEWDQWNFKNLEKGAILGKVSRLDQIKLIDPQGKNIFNQYFSITENNLIVKSSFIPGMLTKNIPVAKSDCLGYVMQKQTLP